MSEYDLIIIGGGPAGATVGALTAAGGRRVLLLEQSRFPRHKLCGEFLSPECGLLLARLGVLDRLRAAGAREIRRMDLVAPDGRRIEVPLEWLAGGGACALGISRARMDEILLARARELGVEVREGFHVSPRLERSERWREIEGSSDGTTRERFGAPLVVDATGRGGLFGPRRAGARRGARLFGCKVHLRGVEGLGGRGQLYFFKDGYGGLSEVEDGLANLCFLTTEERLQAAKGDRQRLLELTVLSNPVARRRLAGSVVAGEWHGAGPIVYGRQPPAPGAIRIGDAGAFIDPFTGSGLLLALTSGALAAGIIGGAGREEPSGQIEQRYARAHGALFGWRYRATALLRRMALEPAARRLALPLLLRQKGLLRLLVASTRWGAGQEVLSAECEFGTEEHFR